jgi:hypothetical protein
MKRNELMLLGLSFLAALSIAVVVACDNPSSSSDDAATVKASGSDDKNPITGQKTANFLRATIESAPAGSQIVLNGARIENVNDKGGPASPDDGIDPYVPVLTLDGRTLKIVGECFIINEAEDANQDLVVNLASGKVVFADKAASLTFVLRVAKVVL